MGDDFGDESFQTINCTAYDNKTEGRKISHTL